MPQNDYYNPVDIPQLGELGQPARIGAELQRIKSGFDVLPSKQDLLGGLHVYAEEAATSAADVYVLTSTYPVSAYQKGMYVTFFVQNTNTGPATGDLDGNGVKAIVNIDGTALGGGEMIASWPADLVYDGTSLRLKNSALSVTTVLSFSEALIAHSFERSAAITDFTLPTGDGDNSPFTYAVTGLPTGLSFDTGTRVISGTPTALGTATVVYTVTDNNNNTFSAQFTIRIVATLLAVSDPMDRTLTEGNEYSFTLPSATGGTSPYEYEIGTLPEGMSFDSTSRVLSGAPTEVGTFNVSYQATDSGMPEQSAIQTFTIVVNYSASLDLMTPSDQEFVPNSEITPFTLPAATGGALPYVYIVTGLPAGLSFDDDTRIVSGTPTTVGESEVTYRVRDDDGNTVDRQFEIEIQSAGRRYVAVVDDDGAVTADEVEAGNDFASNATLLTMPDWSGEKFIVVAQPAANADYTHISLQGLGNSLNDFTKVNYTVTIDGTSYEVWISNDDQGDVISGENLTVAP